MNIAKRSAALCCLFLLAGPTMVSAQQTSRKLVVNSSATVHAKPDAARLTFYVVTEAAVKVREENDKHVKKMKDQLTALGIANVEIQVVPFSLSMVNAGEVVPKGVPQPKLQHAQTQFVVTVRDKNVEKLREVIARVADTATENGGRGLSKIEDPLGRPPPLGVKAKAAAAAADAPKIEWVKENHSAARSEAVKQAVADALANAQAIAGDAKVTVVEIVVNAREDRYVPLSVQRANAEQANSEIAITVDVTVTYSY